MKSIAPLTKRQREVYDYIAAHLRDTGFAPSLEEIGVAMNLSSLATVHKHLSNLAERGYIARSWNRARSITLLVGPNCCPTCGRDLEAKAPLEMGRKSDTMGSTVDASTSAVPTTTEVP